MFNLFKSSKERFKNKGREGFLILLLIVGVFVACQGAQEDGNTPIGPSNSNVGNQQWSPQIQIGVAVLLPGDYVPDLSVRLALYRRLAAIEEADEIDGFAAELIDRFGPLPESAEYLLRVVRIKQLCRRASIDQIDAGHKGAVLGFRDNVFAAPEELIKLISESNGKLRVRPDQKLVFSEEWPTAETRFVGLTNLVGKMISLISTNSGDPFDASD